MATNLVEWRQVPGWPRYEVSSEGQIRQTGGRVLKPWANENGYLFLQLRRGTGEKARNTNLHRLVCETFHGAPPSAAHQARHLDGDPSNNRPGNLEWGTSLENEADKREHGRVPRGAGHRNAKLCEAQVLEVKARLQRGETGTSIAKLMGVAKTNISSIKSGQTWRHVTI